MPSPTPNQLHIDTYLTDMAIVYSQDASRFVADKIFPVVPVQKESDYYAIYKKGYFLRDQMEIRPLGGRPGRAGWGTDKARYSCDEWSLEDAIDDRVRANADQPLDPDMASMMLLTNAGLIRRENEWANAYFKTGVWTSEFTGVASSPTGSEFIQFDQTTSVSPIEFFQTRKFAIGGGTGWEPNVLVLGVNVFQTLANHDEVVDRIKYTQRGIVTEDILAALLGFDKIVVPKGVQNTAAEGQADAVSYIVGANDALMVYANPAPSIQAPSAGYTFAWTGLIPGVTNAMGLVIERGREELAHSDIVQARMAFDVQITAQDLGEFYSSAVSGS